MATSATHVDGHDVNSAWCSECHRVKARTSVKGVGGCGVFSDSWESHGSLVRRHVSSVFARADDIHPLPRVLRCSACLLANGASYAL